MNGVVDLQGRALLTVPIRTAPEAETQPIEAWIDTGFTGELVMPRSQVERLGLKPGMMVRAVLADGRNSRLKSFVAWIDWFGETLEVEVVAGEGQTILLGVGLMLGRWLVVDYDSMSLTLECPPTPPNTATVLTQSASTRTPLKCRATSGWRLSSGSRFTRSSRDLSHQVREG